jgi:hypothetical protein
MGFRENLLKKIQIEELAEGILRSIGPADSEQRMDRESMRKLLEVGPYQYLKERDLDLYRLNETEILALDNELKIYRTTPEDIGLRKSPTIKEMVSFRNAIKIMSDKDVVISRKADTVMRIRSELVAALDLSFSKVDIETLAADGSEALKNGYADGVIEILTLFAELLHFQKAPKIFQVPHHQIWGALERPRDGESRFGPLVMFGLIHNDLKMIKKAISSLDKNALENFHKAAGSEDYADLAGAKVWLALQDAVLETRSLAS